MYTEYNRQCKTLIFIELTNSVYGLNLSRIEDSVIESTTPGNGIRFLLYVAEHDSCDAGHLFTGAGFKVFISDIKDGYPADNVLSRISLVPGYRIDVSLKPTLFNRKTKDLGLCHSGKFPFIDENVYYKSLCYDICTFKLIFENCHCMPPFITGYENYFTNLLKFNVSKYLPCT